MVGLGVGESLGVIVNGFLQDRMGLKFICCLNILEIIVAFIVLLWYTQVNEFDIWSAALVNFVWGFQDAGVNNFACCVCGF
jgi:predicted MFS family arabinose efflux permease